MRINWKIVMLVVWSLVPIALLGALLLKKPKDRDETLPPDAPAFNTVHKVIYVYDGDSFTIKDNGKARRVRLMGTDAPERGQAYGDYAHNTLAELILNKNIKFIYQTADHYNRLLGRICVVDSAGEKIEIPDVGLELINRGATWTHRPHSSFRLKYTKAQQEAKSQNIGLWADEMPLAPEKYREQNKKQ
jgi:endonuclease YncB( thermonuclease family)